MYNTLSRIKQPLKDTGEWWPFRGEQKMKSAGARRTMVSVPAYPFCAILKSVPVGQTKRQ